MSKRNEQATLKIGRMLRAAVVSREAVNVEQRTVELAFSSEEPVERWFGTEILGHKAGEMQLDWLSSGRAPYLVDHNTRQQIGVIERAWLGNDGKGRALARYGTSPQADQELKDAAGGIRVNISVGYRIDELQLVKSDGEPDDGESIYRATKWTPLELSVVSLPADMSVGIGRGDEDTQGREVPVVNVKDKRSNERTDNMETPEQKAARETAERAQAAAVVTARTEAAAAERQRTADILALGTRHNQGPLASEHIAKGTSLADFRGVMLETIKPGTPLEKPQTDLDLSEREASNYSFVRAMAAMAGRGEKQMKDVAPFEIEAHAEIEKRLGRAARGMFVPLDAQRAKFAAVDQRGQRDLTVGSNSGGGYTVSTDLRPADFITLLRNQMMTRAMGAKVLTGLVGNVAFPKQTAAGTAYWVAESGAPTETAQTFGQVTMAPKTVAAYTDISRLLLKQSSLDIENLVRTDLSEILALAADLAALHGSGSSNQPTGIAATSGIGSVAGGTNGLAPTWAHIVALESAVSVVNAAIGATGYLSNAAVRGKLKTTLKNPSGTDAGFIWPDTPMADGMGSLNGYKVGTSNQVSSTLTKGNQSLSSAIFFGNWNDLLIGEWGVLDVLVNPYTGATAGDVRVHTFMSMDIAVRRAGSFAAMLDALTA